MGLETSTTIKGLVASNPASGDGRDQGDDHLRLIKAVLQATFPGLAQALFVPVSRGSSGNITADDIYSIQRATAAITLNLAALASLPAGFVFLLDATAFAVVLDPNAAETVKGASTYTVGAGNWALVIRTASDWAVLEMNPTLAARVWGTVQTFPDDKFELIDNADNTKKVIFQLAGLATGVTRTIAFPDASVVMAALDLIQTFTKPQRGAVTVDNDLSFDLNVGNNFTCTPSGSGTLTFTNIAAGQSGYVILVNGSNYAIAKAAAIKSDSNFLATISATGTYMISYYSPDGTNVYVGTTGALS